MAIDIGKADVIWSYLGVITSMGANVLMLPFIVYFLDGDMLGLWYVFTSMGALTALFDFGFSVTFARNVTYCWSGATELKKEGVVFADSGETNFLLLKRILRACRIVYFAIALSALALLLSAGTAYVLYIARGIEGQSYLAAWLIYCVAIFLNLYYGYFVAFLRGVGAIADANKNTVIARCLQMAATLILLFAGFGIVGACVAYLLYGFAFRILGKRKFYSYHSMRERLEAVNLSEPKSEALNLVGVVWHNAWRDGVVSLSNYLATQASTIICSLYLTLTATGAYSLGVQMATAVATVSATLYTAYQPKLQSAYINGEADIVRQTMSLVVCSFLLLFVLGTALVIVVGLPVFAWIRPESTVGLELYLALSLYQMLIGFRNCYTSYFSSTNRIPYVWAFLVSSAACVLLQLLFVGVLRWAEWGLVFGQLLSQLAFNVWYWPRKAHAEMDLRARDMWRLWKGETWV